MSVFGSIIKGKPDASKRITSWRHGKIKKSKTLPLLGGDDGFGVWNSNETKQLPAGWSIDKNGFFMCNLGAVDLEEEDFINAELHVYPLDIKKVAKGRGVNPRFLGGEENALNSAQFYMSAPEVSLRFHHWMASHIPDFWDVFDYKNSENRNKAFRITFKGQGEIMFYNSHAGHARDEEGATLVVKKENGEVYRLLYESEVGKTICYPGERELEHVGFNLPPNDIVADNLVSVFALVNAVGRMNDFGGGKKKEKNKQNNYLSFGELFPGIVPAFS